MYFCITPLHLHEANNSTHDTNTTHVLCHAPICTTHVLYYKNPHYYRSVIVPTPSALQHCHAYLYLHCNIAMPFFWRHTLSGMIFYLSDTPFICYLQRMRKPFLDGL